MANQLAETRLLSVWFALLVIVGAYAPTGLISVAGAATFVVASTANTADSNPGDGVCNDGTGNCSLVAAIMEANALPGADTINLAVGGAYTLTSPDTIYGVCNFGSHSGLPAITSQITINGNGATVARSGAILTPAFHIFCVYNTGDLTLNGVTVSGGSSPAGGGGVYNEGVTRIVRSTFSGNQGGAGNSGDPGGGAILNWSGTLIIENSTISNNVSFSAYGGGGILNFAGGAVRVINSTIAENRAGGPSGFQGRGDAIADAFSPAGSVTLKNSIVASPATGLGLDCYAVVPATLGHNIDSDNSCVLTGTGDLPNTNPLLGPLANNGGSTMTHALLTGSPALDAVPVADCTDLNSVPLTTDQRGIVRPQGTACDIGAYELEATVLLTVAGTGPFQNQLMVVDPKTCSAKQIGVTQDSSSGPVRKIRGLAYAQNGALYGVTREGDIVKVNRFTGTTTLLGTVGSSPTEFWSGLALDPTGTDLYAVNAFGTHHLARFTLPAGPAVQIGPTRAFNFNFQVLGLAFEPGVTPATMYGANRNNDNIVEVDPLTGALSFTWGNAVVPGINRQQITVRPGTNEIWAIHDHSPFSSNAALHTVVSPFPTGSNTPICELPFGIVETNGGGNDTYGWGGLAFVPGDYNVPWKSCNSVTIHPKTNKLFNGIANQYNSWSLWTTPASATVLSWSSNPATPFPGIALNTTTGELSGFPAPGTYTFTIHVTAQLKNGMLCSNGSQTYTVKVIP